MGMTKAQTSLFLAIFFATIILCAVVICTCFYCYKPSFFLGGRRSKSPTDSSDYTSTVSGSSSDDVEKAPRGRVVVVTTETAARHPSDHSGHSDYAEEVEVLEVEPESDHGHHHQHHLHHGHGEHINVVDANPP